MIHSCILYGIVTCSFTVKTCLGKLSVLQNVALKIMAGGTVIGWTIPLNIT